MVESTGIALYTSSNHSIIKTRILECGVNNLYIYNSDNNSIIGCYLSGSKNGLDFQGSSMNTRVESSDILNQSGYGIRVRNANKNHVNATNVYWDHPSGPYHSSSNPNGTGLEVSDSVEFIKD